MAGVLVVETVLYSQHSRCRCVVILTRSGCAQVDPAFEGMDGGPGSLIKWNPLSNVSGVSVWSFLRTMNVPVNALHSQVYSSPMSQAYCCSSFLVVCKGALARHRGQEYIALSSSS
jgi:hypothetical protein